VWLHLRSDRVGHHTTVPEHMPKAHRAHLEWSPSRLIAWGASIDPHTEALVQALLESRRAARIPSRGIGPVWGFSAWRSSTARCGSMPPVLGRSPPGPGRIGMSNRFSNMAWIGCRRTRPRRPGGPCMPTSAAPSTTPFRPPKESAHAD
jgi:hypothetical protein